MFVNSSDPPAPTPPESQDDALSAGPPGATLQVENVQLQDGNLTWTHANDDSSGQTTIDQVLFTIHPTRSATQADKYIICCLREDAADNPDNPAHPTSLLLLTTHAIPDELLNAPLLSHPPPHLQQTPHNEVDVVVSTKSGVGRARPFWQDVVRPLLQVVLQPGHTATGQQPWNTIITQDAQSVRRYAKSLHPSGPSKTIILISGDGGVVDLLNGRESNTDEEVAKAKAKAKVKAAKLPLLALLPLGTANALFHSLHKPVESRSPGPTLLVLSLRTLFTGTPARLPLFKASFTPGSHIVSHTSTADDGSNPETCLGPRKDTAVSHLYGAVVASYALHASIVCESDTPEYRVHGSKRFGMAAQQLLRESHPYRASVEVMTSSEPEYRRVGRDTHGYVLVSMVSNLEKTFTVSPGTRPLDGKLRLVQFGPVGEKKTVEVMMGAYDGGKHTLLEWEDGEKVRYEEVERVRVVTQEEDGRWRKFCVDGTIVHVERGGGMVVEAVEEAAFRVLVDERVLLHG
ncbi:hypothetical protein C2857_007291 [Epichloe festucae Fl1]|uniref:DAGKc domain-containing protein n=1 Tax=Epichloe festucae (strain Fl1) TaxID=877507 RepID=A0A7S9KML8_EPIFF|nr:hypothetical protein C2857_007291 [Epichloe festucae Fl1]